MPTLHQYDYIFAICLMAAGLDAYNIGANDVSLCPSAHRVGT